MLENNFEQQQPLSWLHSDIERRFGFRGEHYTRVNTFFAGLLAVLATILFYGTLRFIPEHHFTAMFTERGITPYPIVLFGFWTLFLLQIKKSKIRLQRKPLALSILPPDRSFVLTPTTAEAVLKRIAQNAETPKDFLLYRRILLTLLNLKNLGRVADVDNILRSQADRDNDAMETSYTIANGFLWAIPILGFIGTVLGLSDAIGSFGGVLSADADMSSLIPTLKNVTGGLSTAFETTLIALVIALALQLYSVTIRKQEEEFLDECGEYCSINIVSRLRIDFNDTQKQ